MKKVKRLLVFLVIIALLQGLALLFLTPGGLEKVFVLPFRLKVEKFKPDTNIYAVYYDMRSDIAKADVIVVGMDFSVAESYDVLGHFTRFLKQNSDLSAVLMPFDKRQTALSNELLGAQDESEIVPRFEALTAEGNLSADCADYIGEIYRINATMIEAKKFGFLSYSESTGEVPLPKRIAAAAHRTDRSVLCVVDILEMKDSAAFREELEAVLGGRKVLTLGMYYDSSSASAETHEAVSFPFAGEVPACYFVKNRDHESFYRYYRFVTKHLSAGKKVPLDRRFTDYFFIITGGTGIKT